MEKKVTMHCPECGSQNIGIDAVAKWSVSAQEWVLAGTHDCITCNDCDAEFDGADTEEVQPATGDPLSVVCPMCGAAVGQACTSRNGTHKRRTKLAREQAAGGK